MTRTIGPFLLGSVAVPFAIPDGWTWDRDPRDFLMAIAPDGQRWVATKESLHLMEDFHKESNSRKLAEHDPIYFLA